MNKLKILLIAGHGASDPGACSSYGTEATETRRVVSELAVQLKKYEDVEVSIYPTDRNAYADVQNGCVQVNFANYDYVLEIHFNSSVNATAKGVEVWVTPKEASVDVEQRIVNKIANLGFSNRGVKKEYFAVINSAKNKGTSSALIETCFISNKEDMDNYKLKFNQICSSIAEGVAEGFGLAKKETISNNNVEERKYDMKNLVCYCNQVDKRIAEYLADYLKCPCFDATIPFDYKGVAENVIAVGGDNPKKGENGQVGFSGYTTKYLAGNDRYDTIKEVLKYMGKL